MPSFGSEQEENASSVFVESATTTTTTTTTRLAFAASSPSPKSLVSSTSRADREEYDDEQRVVENVIVTKFSSGYMNHSHPHPHPHPHHGSGPLTAIDGNLHGRQQQHHHGIVHPTFLGHPPPPSSPPPSPPRGISGIVTENDKNHDNDNDAYFRNPSRTSFHSARSDLSTVSSNDMTGLDGGGSSNGGAASSHGTTVPADDEGILHSDKDDFTATTTIITPATSFSCPPQRPPPPPPASFPSSYPSSNPSPNTYPITPTKQRSSHSPSIPLAPSHPPPPPPLSTQQTRSSQPPLSTPQRKPNLPNGGPPHPMVDRTRVVSLPQRLRSLDGSTPDAEGALRDNRSDQTNALTTIPSESPISPLTAAPAPAPLPSTATPTPTPTTPAKGKPPHRFSSPPSYNPGASPIAGAGGTSASTTALSALAGTAPAPGPGGLKHRHTLEVPRISPGRNSRESAEGGGGFVSGRFSPTASLGGRRASMSLVRRTTRSLHSDLPRDEVVPDEDALRWTEAYRQRRASKRRRMEMDDDQVLVGTKVDETHANWVAAYNMLTGIRVSVSRTNAKLDRPLTDEDFDTKQKSTFDIAGNELVPSAKYDFKFKDYAPWVFRHLRSLFHLDPADYLMSLAGKYILSELGSPGKSGSFFYFSRDYKYIIKTIHHSEHKFLRKILKDYYRHVTENPNTLLSQFFGLHRVKMPYGRKIHFVVMNNLFPPHRDIHQTFDLKGSTIGRDYPEERIADNPRATLKDLNFLRRHEHLELGMLKKQLFLKQLRRDVELLQRLHIMDYSLLVGVHDLNRGNDENLRDKTLQVFEPGDGPSGGAGAGTEMLMRTPSRLEHQRKTRELRQMLKSERPIPIGQSSNRMPDEVDDSNNNKSVFYSDDGGFQATHQDNRPADEVYYLGVIDCLTHYGIIKKIEHFWKGLSNDGDKISALPPHQYGERFYSFISGITMSPEDVEEEAAAAASSAVASSTVASSAVASAAAAASSGTAAVDNTASTSGRDQSQMATLRHRNAVGGPSSPDPNETDRRESQPPILPVVEEAGEMSSSGEQSRSSSRRVRGGDEGERKEGREGKEGKGKQVRPPTPPKDVPVPTAPIVRKGTAGPTSSPPSTPPQSSSSYLKPESADSGYGVSGGGGGGGGGSGSGGSGGSSGSHHKIQPKLSRESLDKALPPLPRLDA